jgi:hypothetical protein
MNTPLPRSTRIASKASFEAPTASKTTAASPAISASWSTVVVSEEMYLAPNRFDQGHLPVGCRLARVHEGVESKGPQPHGAEQADRPRARGPPPCAPGLRRSENGRREPGEALLESSTPSPRALATTLIGSTSTPTAAQLPGHDDHVALVVHHELRQEAVALLDPPLSVALRDTEVLPVGAAGAACGD